MLLVAHPLLRRMYEKFTSSSAETTKPNVAAAGEARLNQRIRFDFGFAFIFITALHGVSAIKVLSILYINYKIAKTLPRQYIPTVTWVFNISTLFANELCTGYPFERIAALLVGPADGTGQEPPLVSWGRYIDGFGGLIPRWEILFNITVLRFISFNMDYYWSLDYPAASPIEVSLRRLPILKPRYLTAIRRSSSIPPPCRSVTASASRPSHRHSTAAITSPTSSTRHSISRVPS